MPAHAEKIPVVVSVADAHLPHIRQVAERLRAAGMTVDQVMAAAGVISGSVPAGHLQRLRGVEGVSGAEASGTVQLPPPDADVQ